VFDHGHNLRMKHLDAHAVPLEPEIIQFGFSIDTQLLWSCNYIPHELKRQICTSELLFSVFLFLRSQRK
jgi:hypothetical protein